VIAKLLDIHLRSAAQILKEGIKESLTYMIFQETTGPGSETTIFWKDELGDQEKDPGGCQLPRRSMGLDAGVGQTQACRRYPLGAEMVSRYGQALKPKPNKEDSRSCRG
jgi:hypothetical protein